MKRLAVLLVLVPGLAACASNPETDRPVAPDRPEVMRPDGVEPDGLADMRSAINEQRAEARERSNALDQTPTELSTHPTTPWYESTLSTIADIMQILRNL